MIPHKKKIPNGPGKQLQKRLSIRPAGLSAVASPQEMTEARAKFLTALRQRIKEQIPAVMEYLEQIWPHLTIGQIYRLLFIHLPMIAEAADPAGYARQKGVLTRERFLEHWQTPETIAEAAARKAEKKRADYLRKARIGTFEDELVTRYLKAFHAGQIHLPEFTMGEEGSRVENDLLFTVHHGIVYRPQDLRKLADAVQRVHGRAQGEGRNFRVTPPNPAVAAVAAMPGGGTVPIKSREIIEAAKASGAEANRDGSVSGLSERTARRLSRNLGMERAKPGRPRKRPK